MSLPGLARDLAVIKRPAGTADSEGNPTGALSTIYNGFGTYGTPSERDRLVASNRGQIVDAVLAIETTTTFRPGDVVTVRSYDWVVVGTMDVRTHTRLFLQRAE